MKVLETSGLNIGEHYNTIFIKNVPQWRKAMAARYDKIQKKTDGGQTDICICGRVYSERTLLEKNAVLMRTSEYGRTDIWQSVSENGS